MNDLRDRTILITGASRGIGRALAERCARDGARLAICGRDEAALAETGALSARAGAATVFARAFDLATEDEILAFLAGARRESGPIDILVNNAGYNSRKVPLVDVDTAELDAMIAVNLRAPFILMREVAADMKAAGRGHVVNVLSTVCHADIETMGAYTGVKQGLDALTRVFRKEVRADGIRVTAVYPGGTDTEFRAQRRPDYMRPESVAEVIWRVLTMPDDAIVHELTFRPMVESNF